VSELELFTLGEAERPVRGRIEGPEGPEGPESHREGDLRPHVLVLHGFKGFMDWGFFPELSRRLAAAGLVAVSFNRSGSGIGADLETFSDEEGFAANTLTRDLEDIDRVRRYVRSGSLPGVDPARGAVFGHSRGGAHALVHAAEHGDYMGVVTWSAVDSHARLAAEVEELWRREGHVVVHNARTGQDLRLDVGFLDDLRRNTERLDVLAACARLTTPTLLVHGAEDESVPVAALEALFAAIPQGFARRLSIAGTGHTFGAVHPLQTVPEPLETALRATLEHFAGVFGPDQPVRAAD